MAVIWQVVFSQLLKLCYHTVRNQAMYLNLFCLITSPDARDTCEGMILSSVPLLTHQFLRISNIHILTFSQQCNSSTRYIVSAVLPFTSFLFHFEFLLQLEQVMPLDKNSNNEYNQLLQTLCSIVRKIHLHWKNQYFPEF